MKDQLQPEGDNNFIYGILYGDPDGEIYLLNDGGTHRVVMDTGGMLQPARCIIEVSTTDIQWKSSGEVETWDSNILSDLFEDMKDENKQNPEEEIVYILKDCRSIVVSGN